MNAHHTRIPRPPRRAAQVGGTVAAVSLLVCAQSSALAGGLPSLDEPLKSGNRATADAAVVVGIEDYAFVPDVPFANRDARAMYQFLVYTRGVPSEQVHLLDKGVNREALLKALETARAEVSTGGTLWVYFAGHGAASPTTGERLLLGDDVRGDAATLEARGVALSQVLGTVKGDDHHALVIVDACYSGAGRGGEPVVEGRFAVPASALSVDPQVALWTAADQNQTAMPLEGAEHGAFTFLLVGAMRGWADGQMDGKRDGTVTAEEAFLYVQDGLRTLQVRGQSSTWTGSSRADWSLVTGPSLEATPELDPSAVHEPPSPAPPPEPEPEPAPPTPTPEPVAVPEEPDRDGVGLTWVSTGRDAYARAYGLPGSDGYFYDNGLGCVSLLAQQDGIWTESVFVGKKDCGAWPVVQVATDATKMVVRPDGEDDITLVRRGTELKGRTGTWSGTMAYDRFDAVKEMGAALGLGRRGGKLQSTEATLQLTEKAGTMTWMDGCTASLRLVATEEEIVAYRPKWDRPLACDISADVHVMEVAGDKAVVFVAGPQSVVTVFGVLDRTDLETP